MAKSSSDEKQDDFERTIRHGKAALGSIKRFKLSANPQVYEFWYSYSLGFNSRLNERVNDIIEKKNTILPEEIVQIYDELISPLNFGDKMDEIGSDVAKEISSMIASVSESITSTSDFGDSLKEMGKVVKGATDRESLKAAVESLAQATRKVAEDNKNLNERLKSSKGKIVDLQERLQAIRYESLIDALTTLSNRKHFDETLMREIEAAEAGGQPLCLMMSDIDHFKRFNDTFGHQTGDQVLRLVAMTIKQSVEVYHTPCRYGGEEFGVVLPRCDVVEAFQLAEKIRKAVMGKDLVKRSTGESLGTVTISLGVTAFQKGDKPVSMIERADEYLYEAKRAGRNRVCCDPEVQAKLSA